jgi:hypothetical protein
LGRRGHHDGKVEELAKLGVREDVLAVEGGVPVASNLVEPDLKVEDNEHLDRLGWCFMGDTRGN